MNGHDSFMRQLLFLPPQASSIAKDIDALHYAVIVTTMAGAVLITLVSAAFCVKYRWHGPRKPDERAAPGPTPPLWAELTVIGGLFALFVAFWGVGFWQFVQLVEPPSGTYDIYVSAKQWMWKFAYPAGNHSLGTLYVPAGRPIRLVLTSRDVIHSFYVPDFRIKHDAVPGRYTSVWFTAPDPGTHQIFCAEYCGTDHSRMLGQVVVLSPTDFARWLEAEGVGEPDQTSKPAGELNASLVTRGESMAAKYGCLRCHSIDGSPHIGPTWKGLYGSQIPLKDGKTVLADVAYLTESMMDPLAKVHRGYAAVMPSYLGYLQPAEVGAIVEFMKSLRPTAATAAAPLAAPDGGVYALPEPSARAVRRTREPPAKLGEPAGAIGQELAP